MGGCRSSAAICREEVDNVLDCQKSQLYGRMREKPTLWWACRHCCGFSRLECIVCIECVLYYVGVCLIVCWSVSYTMYAVSTHCDADCRDSNSVSRATICRVCMATLYYHHAGEAPHCVVRSDTFNWILKHEL